MYCIGQDKRMMCMSKVMLLASDDLYPCALKKEHTDTLLAVAPILCFDFKFGLCWAEVEPSLRTSQKISIVNKRFALPYKGPISSVDSTNEYMTIHEEVDAV